MSLPEPEWVNGDDVARGLVDECPRADCQAIAYRNGVCEECGYREGDIYDPFDYTDDGDPEYGGI